MNIGSGNYKDRHDPSLRELVNQGDDLARQRREQQRAADREAAKFAEELRTLENSRGRRATLDDPLPEQWRPYQNILQEFYDLLIARRSKPTPISRRRTVRQGLSDKEVRRSRRARPNSVFSFGSELVREERGHGWLVPYASETHTHWGPENSTSTSSTDFIIVYYDRRIELDGSPDSSKTAVWRSLAERGNLTNLKAACADILVRGTGA